MLSALATASSVSADADVEAVKVAALADEKVTSRLTGRTIVKVVAVPGKQVQPSREALILNTMQHDDV